MFFKTITIVTILLLLSAIPASAEDQMQETDLGCLYQIGKDGSITVQSVFGIKITARLGGEILWTKVCIVQIGSKVVPLRPGVDNQEYFKYLCGPDDGILADECEKYLVGLTFPMSPKEIRHVFCPKKKDPKKQKNRTGNIAVAKK